MVYYLLNTDCGLKNANTIIYIGLAMHVISTYFGFVSRFITMLYHFKRANAFKRQVNVKITNHILQYFGFRNFRNKLSVNHKIESLMISGETYEYLLLDDQKVGRLEKTYEVLKDKAKIEFFEFNKVKLKEIRQAKNLLLKLNESFTNLKYFTIQQCSLCPNFGPEFKTFIKQNDSLFRISLIMN